MRTDAKIIIVCFGISFLQLLYAAASSGPSSVEHDVTLSSNVRSKRDERARAGRSVSPRLQRHIIRGHSRLSCAIQPSTFNKLNAELIESGDSNKLLHLPHNFTMPEGRGQVVPHQIAMSLLVQDYASGERLYDLFMKDHERGLPWPLALIYCQLEDGGLVLDFADGRSWYNHLLSNKSTKHPENGALLIGSSQYYLIEQIDKKFEASYLGSCKKAKQRGPEGMLLRGILSDEQNPDRWHQIGATCSILGKYDAAIEWFTRVLTRLQTEGKDYGFVEQSIAEIYMKKEEWAKALGLLKRVEKRYHEEGRVVPAMINLMGRTHEEMSNVSQAFAYFLWATEKSAYMMDYAVNILCLCGRHEEKLSFAAADLRVQNVAKRYLAWCECPEGKNYMDKNIIRGGLARKTALKFLRESDDEPAELLGTDSSRTTHFE